ncbi:glycopeptide antibiotics resistance protein [Solibacillus kalamii]|nr:VanZ family protein [Solibacillus kalamii]MBM7664952.1 glycopeptide antibiotics resistance protein [Solibacillus kalamii]
MIHSFLLSMIAYCTVSFPIYCILRMFYMKNKTRSARRELVMLLFFFYSISIFSQTIIPSFQISNGQIIFDTSSAYVRSNFTPLQTIMLYYDQLNGPLANIAFYNLAGNIVLFIPFGFFIPLLWKKFRGWRIMHVVAFAIPLFIEGTQYFIGRSIDVDDVLLNAIAIVIGFVLFKIFRRLRKMSAPK